jgi:protein-tyrosine kinase
MACQILMSKVYEALLKLERESGKLPPGVLPEALEVLQNGSANYELAADGELGTRVFTAAGETEPSSRWTPDEPESALSLALVPTKLALVPTETVHLSPKSRIVYHAQPHSPGADRFRLLRMRLRPLWDSGKLKTLFVTSARPRDGKSTVVMNLATALAEQGQRKVLVVEGDLYHASLSSALGIPLRAGLAECLEEDHSPLSLLRRLDPLGWYLLPAGRVRGNPTELLQIPKLAAIFETLRPCFDWIIIDTPPVAPLTDTLSLKQHADAGLLVVRADRTPGDEVDAAIGRVGAGNLLGIVLNGSTELDRVYADYSKSYGLGLK